MKRSRIFLAVTSGLLAIAGVAAARATHFGSTPGYFYTVVGGAKTVVTLPLSHCKKDITSAITCLTINASGKTTIVYTKFTAPNVLANPLHYRIS